MGPGQVECDDANVVEPGSDDVIVRTDLASICGSDLHLIFQPGPDQVYPAPAGFPGHEGIGVVEHSNYSGLAAGDRVLTIPSAFRGTCFNELQTLHHQYCIKLPETDDTATAPADVPAAGRRDLRSPEQAPGSRRAQRLPSWAWDPQGCSSVGGASAWAPTR